MGPGRKIITDAALYFHYPCFDGLVSGVLAWVFLEEHRNWQIDRFFPVNYNVHKTWLGTVFSAPTAVVDFLYHPQASFWADHHLTTFITENAREDFERRKVAGGLIFDGQAKSCASLLWRHVGSQIPDEARYEDMVSWADKIDSASYSSVQEAICGDTAAMRINRSLISDNALDSEHELEYARFLLKELRTGDLRCVAQLAPVSERFERVQHRITEGLKKVEGKIALLDGDVAIFDVQAKDDEIISRYAPYQFFPDARYSIGVVRSDAGIKVTAMRNPWRDFESIRIGKVLEEFGGGGHQRVGAVVIPPEQAGQVPAAVDRLVSEMRSHTPAERVTA
jgi:hypothetical protein